MNLDPRNLIQQGPSVKDFYVGVDLGQKRDYTVIVIVEKKNRHITLRQVKQFPLGTEYDTIVEYLKVVAEKFQTVRGFYIDRTGVGEVFVENCIKHGLQNVQGIVLTMPAKQEVMTCLKQTMLEKRMHMPRDRELENEMNGEIAEITSTGKTKFHHRSGTHDDRLWALGLAVYGARIDVEPYHPVAALSRRRSFFERFRGPGPDWTDWVKMIKGETMQDKHDQSLTQTSLSAGTLRRDPRAILGMTAPAIRSLPGSDKTPTLQRRVCLVCWSSYIYEPGKDSHVDTSNKTGRSFHDP